VRRALEHAQRFGKLRKFSAGLVLRRATPDLGGVDAQPPSRVVCGSDGATGRSPTRAQRRGGLEAARAQATPDWTNAPGTR
jgi:hypothetical protein